MPKLSDRQAQNIIRYLRGLEGIETRGNKYSKSKINIKDKPRDLVDLGCSPL